MCRELEFEKLVRWLHSGSESDTLMNLSELFVLDTAGWPALLVDEAGTVIRANEAAVMAFGPVVAAGSQLSAIWGDPAKPPAAFLAHWVNTPAPAVTLKLKWKAGGVAAHTVSICSIQRGEQRLILLQLLGETANADAVKAHKQKLDCALQLARTVSLDFNNALTSILGHTSLILENMQPDHPWRKSLLEVEKSAAKAAEISNDLGSFSRQEKDAKSQSSGNLNDLVQRCLNIFRLKTSADQVKWVSHVERRLFLARFDEGKILQALMRIVENSIEAMAGPGQVAFQTRNVELQESTRDCSVQLVAGNYVCLEVADTGKGIEPEILPRVFEPFFTTKRNHRGLGLAWVYGIVTNHGGGVAISSTPNSGTSVRMYLPAETRRAREGVANGREDLQGSHTVLIVDDEDLILTMAQAILSSYGYHVLTASSGQKALEIIRKHESEIHLMVTDLVMPLMSGRELVEQVRRLSPHTRIFCISGYAWPAGRENDSSYLQKPFTSRELLVRVKEALT